jgi:hypothetical protein
MFDKQRTRISLHCWSGNRSSFPLFQTHPCHQREICPEANHERDKENNKFIIDGHHILARCHRTYVIAKVTARRGKGRPAVPVCPTLSGEANERMNHIAIVKPQEGRQIEDVVVSLARQQL